MHARMPARSRHLAPQIILGALSGERCEASDEGIAEFVGSMKHNAIANALEGARRAGPIRVYERTSNFRR